VGASGSIPSRAKAQRFILPFRR